MFHFLQLANDRRRRFCAVCPPVYTACVCWLEALPPVSFLLCCLLSEDLHKSWFQPALFLVYLLYCVFKSGASDSQRLCAGSRFDPEPGTGSRHTFGRTAGSETICAYVPLISCLWNEELCYYSQVKRKRRKDSGGKEKKKVKLNKFHFSAFNLFEHRARRKLGEDSACFSSDGFSFLNIKLMKHFTPICLFFRVRRTELKVSIIVKSESRWHRKQECVSMKSD